ncbi:MAG: ABC transporter permease [Defluviitaleaceae bacterium]|nr:ABC transporter permease [Defluviitaleaceae bacterium]
MTALKAAYHNETDKLLLRKKYIVFLIIGAIICVLFVSAGAVASGLLGHLSGFAFNITPSPIGVLPLFSQVIIPLLVFMGAADLITAESSDSTMKAMICRPVERWKLYTAKLLAIVSYAAVYLGCIFVLSTLVNLATGSGIGFSGIFNALVAYVITLFPLAVLATFAALVALFGKSSTLTMLLLIVIYATLNVLPFLFPSLFDMLFTSYLGWYRLWIGVLPNASRILHMLAIVGGYGIVFFTAGSLIFDRKEY